MTKEAKRALSYASDHNWCVVVPFIEKSLAERMLAGTRFAGVVVDLAEIVGKPSERDPDAD